MTMRMLAALLLALSGPAMADIFDKAETGKDCVQNGSNCEGHKWLGKIAAAKKCKLEGNCVDKINEAAAKNQDKIQAGVHKVETVNTCANAQDAETQKRCYEAFKAGYRARQAKKQEAARAMQDLASQPKRLGDSVCYPGKLMGLLKVTVKGFVEQVSGDRIQIRIVDTESQEVSYQGVSLRQNSIIWDTQSNWIQCAYLKKR